MNLVVHREWYVLQCRGSLPSSVCLGLFFARSCQKVNAGGSCIHTRESLVKGKEMEKFDKAWSVSLSREYVLTCDFFAFWVAVR